MARRRLNTRFLIVTASIVGLTGGVGLILYKNQKPKNPLPYIQAGDLASQKGDFATAIKDYSYASELMKNSDATKHDPIIHLKLGNAYYELRSLGAENFQQAVSEFTTAEELKPDSKDAWRGLLQTNEYLVEMWETRPGDARDREMLPQSINLAREAAQHLVKLDPTNPQALAAKPILLIRVWVLNLPMPDVSSDRNSALSDQGQAGSEPQTPDQIAESAMDDLSKLMQQFPENDQMPYWLARAKIYQAQQALKTDHPENAAPLFAEAAKEFDASIQAKPDVVGLYLSKATILGMLQTTDTDPRSWQDYRKKQHDALEIAQAKVDPKNPQQYKLAKQQWAADLSMSEPGKAEDVYRDLIKTFPDELLFRIQLAKLLQRQPGRQDDALALLDEVPSLQGPPVTNLQMRNNWDSLAAYCKLVHANIATDKLPNTPPGKARTDLVNDIQSSIDAAQPHFGGTSTLLRILGHFQLVNGQTRDAILTLSQAHDKQMQESSKVDPDLLVEEATAYRNGQQLGKAIELLEKVVGDSAVTPNPELMSKLAQLNIENKDFAKAKQYVDWLAQRLPNDPRVITLQIRQLGPTADWASVKPLFDKLDEKTLGDLGLKYTIAAQLGNKDESIRLVTLIHQQDPTNVRTTASLLQLLITANRNDDAKKVLADAQQKTPDDPTLKIFGSLLDHASGAKLEQDEMTLIMAEPDPFIREGKLAGFYASKENPEEEMVHLKKQLELQPNDKDVLQTMFIRHLDAKRFADAEALLPHMSELDVDDAHGLMLKTKLALAKQDVPNALTFSRQMTQDYPNFAGSWEMFGEALRDSGQLDSACEQFNKAVALQATNLDSWKNLIQCSVQQGKLEDAKSYIAKACARFPNDPEYRDMRVQFEILYGNPESVLPELNEAVDKHPGEPRNYRMLASALQASIRAKAQMAQPEAANQHLAEATDLLHKAVTRWPDDLRFTNALSELLQQSGDFGGAEDALKAISARPHWKDQPAPLILLGKVYLAAGKPALAQEALQKALDADGRSVDAHLVMADCLIRQQKYDQALAVLQPATADFRVRNEYTDLLIALGRGSQAEVNLQEAIKASPTNMGLTNLLLHVYDSEGEYDRGIRAANDDIQNDPRNVFAYLWRGKMEGSGPNADIDAALKDLQFFRDSVPTSIEGRLVLAQALDVKRDHEGAIHELETALGFDPQNRTTRLMLLNDYLGSTPPRTIDAETLLNQTLAIPALQHDPEFESADALLVVKKGTQNDKAVALMQDAMQHTPHKSDLTGNYFTVLLATKDPTYLRLLLDESNQYVADPKSSWLIFNDRGLAKAMLHDPDGAAAEFSTAMDRAILEKGSSAADKVSQAICQSEGLGIDKAIEMIIPRAQNSVTWKLVAINLYIAKGDTAKGVALAEGALQSASTLSPDDQFHLYQQASSLYLNSVPPQVDKAVAIYQKILAVQPDDITALNDMACVLTDMSTPAQPEQALVYSQRAFDVSQKNGHLNPRINDTQGWVLVLNKRVDDGIDIMHRTIGQADFPEAHYHLAYAYLQKQLPQEAQEELNHATDMIEKLKNDHQPVDPTLKDKIDGLSKLIDDAVGVKSSGKTAS